MRQVVIGLTWTSDAKAQKKLTGRSRTAEVDGVVTVDGVTIVPGLEPTMPGPYIRWTQP